MDLRIPLLAVEDVAAVPFLRPRRWASLGLTMFGLGAFVGAAMTYGFL